VYARQRLKTDICVGGLQAASIAEMFMVGAWQQVCTASIKGPGVFAKIIRELKNFGQPWLC
jgi:dihydroorotate dehydrogenase